MLNRALDFQTIGTPVRCVRYGNGHINTTYLVTTDRGVQYILQKINHQVFGDVPRLMQNIAGITRHLSAMQDDPRRVLTIVPSLEGHDFLLVDGEYWRMYVFVTDSLCLERAQTPADFRESGTAFGNFQRMLAHYPAASLHETIPFFHHTPKRYEQLEQAKLSNAAGRLKSCEREIDFAAMHRGAAGTMVQMQAEGVLPIRVTHNDTKLNNVLLDAFTRQALCVIDLDTVMPGLAGNDFGDSIRFGASTAAEDEKDLSCVQLSLDMYKAYAKGFLSECRDSLQDTEIATLALAAKLMTLECGVRFLADYLNGDIYFHTNYPNHNLDRCRTQFKLVADMELHWQQMTDIVQEEATL